ncbi:hypothetical protein [Rathayibacter soli]|uniref:hypothetical protein n=1 Tax=Rathayibacter soli TaxID=3144168 RepID=UPI0027E52D43|nr:hypothetical protein [Glaciibacter superstes]
MYFSGISVLILVIYVALAAALAWALVLWLIVGHRWLSLHPKSGKSVQLPSPDASLPPPPPSA